MQTHRAQRQFFAHDFVKLDAVRQNCEQFCNAVAKALEFIANFLTAKAGKAVRRNSRIARICGSRQAVGIALNFIIVLNSFDQFDIRRDFCDWPITRTQLFARFGGARRAANDRNHFIKIGDCNHQAKQDMRPVARLVRAQISTAG